VLIAFTWVGLGVADLVGGAAFAATWLMDRFVPERSSETAVLAAAEKVGGAAEPALEPAREPGARRSLAGRHGWALLIGEMAAAVILVAPVPIALPDRQRPQDPFDTTGVSEAYMTSDSTWMHAVLAPPDKGGLPADSVLVSWWSASTTLWYGQRVLHLRPDIYIVDDRTRLDDNLGSVQDVFNRFLGNRPVFTIRIAGGVDGMQALSAEFKITPFKLGDGSMISQVIGRKGSQ
jgi:hypothetical protein